MTENTFFISSRECKVPKQLYNYNFQNTFLTGRETFSENDIIYTLVSDLTTDILWCMI